MNRKLFVIVSVLVVSMTLTACAGLTGNSTPAPADKGCVETGVVDPSGSTYTYGDGETSKDGKWVCTAEGPNGPYSWKRNTQSAAQAYQPAAPAATETPKASEAPSALWDNTCKAQSELVGVALKPLVEGNFFTCVYNGKPSQVSIPAGTMADIDLGGIHVATGPVTIEGVPNLTLRPWRTGNIAEACAQVENLTAYGQKQSPKFTASPYNFDCPTP